MSAPSPYPALVPAAGASRRMGRPKLSLPYRGRPLVHWVLRALRDGGASPVVAVLRADGTGPPLPDDVLHVVNPEPERGMLSSIQCGLAQAVPSAIAGLLVSPADLPNLSAETVRGLIDRHRSEQPPLLVPVCRGRRGHPLLVDGSLVPEIETLEPRIGLRQLLDRHPVSELPTDDGGCLHDVDTPGDYRHLIRDQRSSDSGR